MTDTKSVSIASLITVPALITLGITILRLVGELQHWSPRFFNTVAGGGAALVGISWLPIIFGPYFAIKLAGEGDGPSSAGKAIGFSFLALVVFVLAGFLFGKTIGHPSFLTLLALLLMLFAAFVPGIGWRSLGNTLLAYAFAARIPVLIVMYLAMSGNGGQGWGTHYDAVGPSLAYLPVAKKYLYGAILPQMTMWIGWTVVVGSIFGTIVAAVAGRGKREAPAAA
jgi:hypothetical protein